MWLTVAFDTFTCLWINSCNGCIDWEIRIWTFIANWAFVTYFAFQTIITIKSAPYIHQWKSIWTNWKYMFNELFPWSFHYESLTSGTVLLAVPKTLKVSARTWLLRIGINRTPWFAIFIYTSMKNLIIYPKGKWTLSKILGFANPCF